MTPDAALLRDVRAGGGEPSLLDAGRPITPEEAAELKPAGPDLGLDWLDPAPFVKIGPDRRGKGLEVVVGMKGTF